MNIVFSHLYNSGYKTGEAMRICGNGNVGIGTTSPNTMLHIRNDTATTGTGDAYIPNIPGGGLIHINLLNV